MVIAAVSFSKTFMVNIFIVGGVALLGLSLVAFLIYQNLKDKRDLEHKLENDFDKSLHKKTPDDPEVEVK